MSETVRSSFLRKDGRFRNKNPGASNNIIGENPIGRKSKVFYRTIIGVELVGVLSEVLTKLIKENKINTS